MTQLGALARWMLAPRRRWIAAAAVTGFALRLAWAVWLAAEPTFTGSDTGRVLDMARQFADGETYRMNGLVTAFQSPGLSLLLTPAAWLSETTGWFSLPLAAGVVNAIAGTATIVAGAVLAARWLGPASSTVAAWLLALAPGPIYLTAVPLTETVFTALVLGALVAITAVWQRSDPPTPTALLGLGTLIGLAALVRSPGLILLPVAWLALRQTGGRDGRSARPALALLGGVVLVLAPWAVRNGIQVRVWTPGATGNAAFLCHGHGPDTAARAEDLTDAAFERCFRGTPYDPDNPDEAAWYGRTVRDAVDWAVHHPGDEARFGAERLIALFENDRQALADARGFGTRDIASPTTTRRLERAGDLWHWSVLTLAVLAVATTAAARRMTPLWLTAGGLALAALSGVILGRFHHTIMALLAVVAGALVLRVDLAGVVRAAPDRFRAWVGDADGAGEPARPAVEEAPPTPSGPGPLAPWLTLLTGGLVSAVLAFDVMSHVAEVAFVYTRGAWLLDGWAALTVTGAAVAVVRGRRSRPGFLRSLGLLVSTVVLLTTSWLVRHRAGFDFHGSAPLLASGLSLSALVLVLLEQGNGRRGGEEDPAVTVERADPA